jgi:hypothetical protein
MRSERTTDLVRLRLAAALTHLVPPLALTIWPVRGPSVVVSRLGRQHPDLSACTFRSMVAAVMAGEAPPVGLPWLLEVEDLSVDGIGVRHVGDGVVALEHGTGQGRWWPTLLDSDALTSVVADAAVGVLEEELVPAEVVARTEVAAHVDTELGVTVVQLRTPPGSVVHERRCDSLARALARSCVVAELLTGAGSGSRA